MENDMKQFNLQEYLANPSRQVITREGKKVRIICTDAKSIYPVLGLMDDGICGERFISCQENGRESNDLIESTYDLFFGPIKHTDWVNLYRTASGQYKCGSVHKTEQNAKNVSDVDSQYEYVTTIKVEWEEE